MSEPEIFTKVHAKNGAKNGKFHAKFTLQGCGAEIIVQSCLTPSTTDPIDPGHPRFRTSQRDVWAESSICARLSGPKKKTVTTRDFQRKQDFPKMSPLPR